MRRGGPLRAAVLAALAVPSLVGCTLLGYPPYFFGDPAALDPDYWEDYEDVPEPSIASTFTTGSATLTLDDGTVIELDRVSANSHFDAAAGASIRWSGSDGYHLMLYGAGADETWGSYEFLQIDRVVDSEHWTIWDENGCAIDIETADETEVTGTASCRGLQWSDAMDVPWAGEPQPMDEPEFDAEVTFEAQSEGSSTSG